MSGYSFYGGKEGRTYNLVAHYDSIEQMINLFSQGGSYTDANYNEYVIIDTNQKTNPENGIIYRRGFNYTEEVKQAPNREDYFDKDRVFDKESYEVDFKNYIKAPGGGAIYVGQIVGPTGDSPSIELLDWSAFETKTSDDNTIILGKQIFTPSRPSGQDQNYTRYGYCNITDSNGNITGAYLAFDFPYTVFEMSADSVSPYGPIIIEVEQLPEEFDENTYYRYNNQVYVYDSSIASDIGPWRDVTDDLYTASNINGDWSYDNLITEKQETRDKNFYYAYDIKIPKGIQGEGFSDLDVITPQEQENNVETETVDDNGQWLAYKDINYNNSAEGEVSKWKGVAPYKVISNISANKTIEEYNHPGELEVDYTYGDSQSFPFRTIEKVEFPLDQNSKDRSHLLVYYTDKKIVSVTEEVITEEEVNEYLNNIENKQEDVYYKLIVATSIDETEERYYLYKDNNFNLASLSDDLGLIKYVENIKFITRETPEVDNDTRSRIYVNYSDAPNQDNLLGILYYIDDIRMGVGAQDSHSIYYRTSVDENNSYSLLGSIRHIVRIERDEDGTYSVIYATGEIEEEPSLLGKIYGFKNVEYEDGQFIFTWDYKIEDENGNLIDKVDTFTLKVLDEIKIVSSYNSAESDTTEYNQSKDVIPEKLQHRVLTATYNQPNTFEEEKLYTINEVLDIKLQGDNIVVLYSDPEKRKNIPQNRKIYMDYEGAGGYCWENLGPILGGNHIQGDFSSLEILQENYPYGFGRTLEGDIDSFTANRQGWVATVTIQPSIINIQDLSDVINPEENIYYCITSQEDEETIKTYYLYDSTNNVFNEGTPFEPSTQLYAYDYNLNEQGNPKGWYLIQELGAESVKPEYVTILEKADPTNENIPSANNSTLNINGFWFVIEEK